jgi:hypothetical protein
VDVLSPIRLPPVIDCDADPVWAPPQGTVIALHRKAGKFRWEPERMKPFVFPNEKDKLPCGFEMHKSLAGRPAPNANVLEHLLAHKDLIPEHWKDKIVFFGGTIYRDGGECYLFARGLLWNEVYGWSSVSLFLAHDWNNDGLVALRAL